MHISRKLSLALALVTLPGPLLTVSAVTVRAASAFAGDAQLDSPINTGDENENLPVRPGQSEPEETLTASQVQRMIDDALAAQSGAVAAQPAQYESAAATAPPPAAIFQPPAWTIDFKNGVFIKSADGDFSLRFNNFTQVDYRNFSQTSTNSHSITSLQDQFNIPRQWLFFRGNATEYIDYTTIIASAGGLNITGGPATVNLLDAYIDFNPFGSEYKDLFQVRLGRYKTPYMYQFYKLSPVDYVTPELSMFGSNFIQNRQIGAMVHGYLADKRIDYAAGIFNGVPNSNEVPQSSREGIYYLGLAPFLLDEGSVLQNLNLVTSAAYGQQFGFALPNSLATAVPAIGPPNNTSISPIFLTFTPSGGVGGAGATTIRQGAQALADFEVVYNYKAFNFYGEYNTGYQTYAIQTAAGAVVPGTTQEVRVSGWSAAATYFLTGETISTLRTRVQPLRRYGDGGVGAFEAFSRFSNAGLSNNVFSDHLANGAIFSNNVNTTDTGVNWYLNQYVKVTFDWQHLWFNNPVSLTGAVGGNMTKTEDMLWGRFQLYY